MFFLKQTQFVPVSLETAWDFFSAPVNLSKITPPEMAFLIHGELPGKMYPGQFIQYTVKPLLGIPVHWVTEITHVREMEFFVDEQRVGPYKIWHHQHFFKEVPGGVEMTDLVHYSLPFGLPGKIFHPLVRKKLNTIFSYRTKKIKELFTREASA